MTALSRERKRLSRLEKAMTTIDDEVQSLGLAMPRAVRLLILARGALSEAIAEIRGEEE